MCRGWKRLIKLTDWSDREIARQLACGNKTVSRWRENLTESVSDDTEGNIEESTREIPGLIDLICGDFEQVAKKMEPQSIDVIITTNRISDKTWTRNASLNYSAN